MALRGNRNSHRATSYRRISVESLESRRCLTVDFLAHPIQAVDIAPEELRSADLDNDGDLDLIVGGSSSGDTALGWFENDGDGNFVQFESIMSTTPQSSTVMDFEVGDLDNDSDLDIIVLTEDNSIFWFENGGTAAEFTRHFIISDTTSFSDGSLAIGDIDADGDLDFLASARFDEGANSRTLLQFTNDGTGAFVEEALFSAEEAEAMELLDVDADGDLDLVRTTIFTVQLLENEGTGFEQFASPIGSLVFNPQDIVVGDFDLDGDPDIVVSETGRFGNPGELRILRNNAGTFTETREPVTAWEIHAVDFNNDGQLDLLANNFGDGVQLQNLGNANFGTPTPLSPSPFDDFTSGDYDNDGYDDVVASQFTGDISVWQNSTTSSGLGPEEPVIVASAIEQTTFLDLDDDGDLDIAGLNATGELVWHEYDETSSEYGVSRRLYSRFPVEHLSVADVDGDGDLDFGIAGNTDTFWLENLGIGAVIEHGVTTGLNLTSPTIYFEDTDLDGDQDAIVDQDTGNAGGGTTWFHLDNDGSGQFGAPVSYATPISSRASATGDMNGDGLPDFVRSGVNGITWHQNLGGSFDPGPRLVGDADGLVLKMITADIDGDGDLDVVSQERGTGTKVYLNNGGSFVQMVIRGDDYASLSFASCLDIGDLDGDGDLDVAFCSTQAATFGTMWAENNGSGLFPTIHGIAQFRGSPFMGDADLDGDLDVVVGGGNSELVYFEQTTPSAMYDFDQDGDEDITDLDLLIQNIAFGPADPSLFDLNNDGLVDLLDRDEWLLNVGMSQQASGQGFLIGDANLDGFVDASDFNLWNENKFSNSGLWSSADFNADGFTDASDFNIWNENKFTSSAIVANNVSTDSRIEVGGFTAEDSLSHETDSRLRNRIADAIFASVRRL